MSGIKKKKILPIKKDNLVDVTECWTFEKLAIIQASQFSEDWLASHLNIIMYSDYSVGFGDSYYKYTPAYYDDILHAETVDYFKNRDILEVIIKNIDRGRYVKYFRWLIYGYDSETRMFSVLFEKSVAGVKSICFDEVEARFVDFLNEFGEENLPVGKENTRLDAAKNFQFPFVTYAIKDDYSTVNCAYSALIKIDREIWGNKVLITDPGDNTYEEAGVYYDGIACLQGLKKYIYALYKGNATIKELKLSKTIKKLHEHRCLLLLSLKYIKERWGIVNTSIGDCISGYGDCCNNVERWCNMALKFEATSDKHLLKTIMDSINAEMEREKSILLEHRKISYDWYNKQDIV